MAHESFLPLLPGESTQSSVVQKNLFPGFDLSDRSDIPVFGISSLLGSDQMKKAQKKLTLSKIDFLSSVIIIGLD